MTQEEREKLTEFEKQLARCEWRGIDVNDLTKEAKEILHRDSKTLLDIARKQFIDKACEWLIRTQQHAILPDTTIERFRKAMEEEK